MEKQIIFNDQVKEILAKSKSDILELVERKVTQRYTDIESVIIETCNKDINEGMSEEEILAKLRSVMEKQLIKLNKAFLKEIDLSDIVINSTDK